MHGGRSTGPRTAQGLARLSAARTVHGGYGAQTRAFERYAITSLRRGRVGNAAVKYADRLPADLVARLWQGAPELMPPIPPTGGMTVAEDRAARLAEKAALAPWRDALAAARPRRVRAPARPHAPVAAGAGVSGVAGALAALGMGGPALEALLARAGLANGLAKPHAPMAGQLPGQPLGQPLGQDPGMPVPGAPRTAAEALVEEPHAPVGGGTALAGGDPAGTAGGSDKWEEPHAPVAGDAVPDADEPLDGMAFAARLLTAWVEAHAPEGEPGGEAALAQVLPNRAARRKWEKLQRKARRAAGR
jgi:hypothetical protein